MTVDDHLAPYVCLGCHEARRGADGEAARRDDDVRVPKPAIHEASVKGRRSKRTYAFRAGAERWAFVPHPEIAGWWFRLHPAVLVAACPYPHCGAAVGEPCKNKDGYVNFLHWDRRAAAKEGVEKLDFAVGVIAEIGRARG